MLESILITIIAMGFISFIASILDENVIFAAVSMLMWIVVMAGQVYIIVPGVVDTYSEPALFAVSLGFIFINVIWMIVLYFDFSFWKRQP